MRTAQKYAKALYIHKTIMVRRKSDKLGWGDRVDEVMGRKISVEIDGSLVDAVDGRYDELKEGEMEERLNFLEDMLIERSSIEDDLLGVGIALDDSKEKMEGCIVQGKNRYNCDICEYETIVCSAWKKVVDELKAEIEKLKSQSDWE